MNSYTTQNSIHLAMNHRRRLTLCNHNYSEEGILHPDRIMEEYDLLYMQSGEWDIIENDITYHVVPGSILLLEPGKHHYSLEKCSPKMRNIYLHFAVNPQDISMGQTFPLNEEAPSVQSVSTVSIPQIPPIPACPYISIPKLSRFETDHDILHMLEKMIDAFWAKDSVDKDLRCSLYLEEFLLHLSDAHSISQGTRDILISEIIHRFDCEPYHFLSPEELADSYHMSVRTLSGRFKKWTGLSIHQYQLRLKLQMAYDALPTSPGRSLHDIALSFGFYDEFQFSKLFKREFGISPSERR